MTSNAEPMVPQIRAEFERLVTYVTGEESQEHTAYTVELTLFRCLLAMGRILLRLFFATRARTRPEAPTLPDGTAMAYHEQRSILYVSVFGTLRLSRHYFTATVHGGSCPLECDQNVWIDGGKPFRCYRLSPHQDAVYRHKAL